MSPSPILWIDLQPSLHCFNQRLAKQLAKNRLTKRWSFQHDLDEACSTETIHEMMLETVNNSKSKYHLIGHGMSGTIAHLFACKYPELVHSATLLSTDTAITNHWTSHYLKMRSQLPCSREKILLHLTSQLFGRDLFKKYPVITSLLAKCLDNEYILGSIASQIKLGALKGSDIPTLVINGNDDFVIDRTTRIRWSEQLKPGDHYRSIENGRHFFHHQEPNQTAAVIESFLDMITEKEIDKSLTIKCDYLPIKIFKND